MKKLLIIALLCGAAVCVQAQKKNADLTDDQKAVMKELLAKYDANKDGKLDKDERGKFTKEDKQKYNKAFPKKNKKDATAPDATTKSGTATSSLPTNGIPVTAAPK